MRGATLTDVITMACARALREHPAVNASYGDDCVIEHERVNIGLALALDDGLTVPVIMDADTRTLEGLSSERLRLADAARARSLRPEEIFAGTFSISNLGPLGVDRFQALVLPPQAAILAVGSLRDIGQPVGVLRSSCGRRGSWSALPGDDRTPARRTRVGARSG